MITHHTGDLFATRHEAIAHGCNCMGKMGAGVALIVATRFPAAFAMYQLAIQYGEFYPGVAQPVVCTTDTWDALDVRTNVETTTVYNLATQIDVGPDARLNLVEQAFRNMKAHMLHKRVRRVAMPRIGAGIGGLDWDDVEAILDDVIGNSTLEVKVYTL